MNLSKIHALNHRLQAAIRTESLDDIADACLDIMVAVHEKRRELDRMRCQKLVQEGMKRCEEAHQERMRHD